MNRDDALKTLRLTTDTNRDDIISAFNKLARRYPLQQFPERHTRLLDAKTTLLNPHTAFKSILTDDVIDLSWLNAYSTDTTTHNTSTQKNATQQTLAENTLEKQCLEAMLRPHIIKHSDLFSMDTGIPTEFADIFNQLGPEELQRIIEQFGPM